MRIGTGIGMTSPLCLRPGRTPRSLFKAGDAGFWFHPADLGTLAQDAAGTVAVSGVGQPIGRILDRSGRGLQATQATAGRRPLHARLPQGARRNTLVNTTLSQWGMAKGGTGQLPVVNTIAATSTAVLPDGAAGAAPGKGWTCTGLALDGASLWWGNYGADLPASTVGQRQLIRTNLSGSAILATVDITDQPQGVAVLGEHVYYAVPTTNQIRRVNKAGGGDVAFLTVAALLPNGLATDGTGFWVSSNSDVIRLSLSGDVQGSFNAGVVVDHLHYDAARDWLWISSGGNGSAGVITIWSLAENRVLNSYRLTQAQAVEGIVLSGNTLIVSHDGYFHNTEIADAGRRLNEVQVYSTAIITGAIWEGGLADHVFFNRGASNTTADFSQLQQNAPVGGARVASAYVWLASGSSNIAVSVADSGGNTQEVETVTTTPTRVQVYRATTGTGEALQIRLRGAVTAAAQLGMFIAGVQVEAGATPTAVQVVVSSADVTERGRPSRYAILHDLVDDALAATLPAGTYTLAHANDAGVTITPGVVHAGGVYTLPGPARLYGAVAINRTLTAAETSALTAWLNARRP